MKTFENWTRRSCPTCSSSVILPNPEIESRIRAESLSFDEVSQYFVGLRKEQVFFSYYRCQQCGLLYCPWYFTLDQLADLYSNMPDNLMGREQEVAGRTQREYGTWTLRRAGSPKNYLELGPDIGLLTSFFVQKGSKNLTLIEPNIEVYSKLRSLASSVNELEIVADLDQISQGKIVDLSVAVHVFDHLILPVQALHQLSSVSSASGKLSLVVHNERSLLRRLLGRKWPPFCLQHPQLYNSKTMADTLARAGWSVKAHRKTVNYFDLKSLALNIEQVIGFKFVVPAFAQRATIGIPLGNMIFLVSKE